jgi:hypothetical protein
MSENDMAKIARPIAQRGPWAAVIALALTMEARRS